MRVAVPEELKQARRVIAEQERLLSEAQARVREALEEQGLLAAIDAERARLIELAEHDAAKVRAGADEYAHHVLEELEQSLIRLSTSAQSKLKEVQNGLRELQGH